MFKSVIIASTLLISGAALAQQAPQKDNFIMGHGFVTSAPAAQTYIPGHQTKDVSLPANTNDEKSRNGTKPTEPK